MVDAARPVVGFIGAGRMGLPMVTRLTGAGFAVVGLARRPETAAALSERGVRVVGSAAEVGAASDVVCVCTFDEVQLRQALLGSADSDDARPDGALWNLRAGACVVVHTTCSPHLIELLDRAAPEGVSVIDVPVSGRAVDILAGTITMLAGGPVEVVEAVRPVLASYGEPIIHVGPLGSGQRTKLVNNLLFAVNVRLVHEVVDLAEELGLDPAAAIRAIQSCSGSTFGLGAVAAEPSPRAAFARFREFLDKDVAVVEGLAQESGIDLGLLGEIASWWHSEAPQPV